MNNNNNDYELEKTFSLIDYALCQIGDNRGINMGVLSNDEEIYAVSRWS